MNKRKISSRKRRVALKTVLKWIDNSEILHHLMSAVHLFAPGWNIETEMSLLPFSLLNFCLPYERYIAIDLTQC